MLPVEPGVECIVEIHPSEIDKRSPQQNQVQSGRVAPTAQKPAGQTVRPDRRKVRHPAQVEQHTQMEHWVRLRHRYSGTTAKQEPAEMQCPIPQGVRAGGRATPRLPFHSLRPESPSSAALNTRAKLRPTRDNVWQVAVRPRTSLSAPTRRDCAWTRTWCNSMQRKNVGWPRFSR